MGSHPLPHPKNLLLTVYYTPLAGCIYTSCLFILVSTTRTLIHSWILFLVIRSIFFFFWSLFLQHRFNIPLPSLSNFHKPSVPLRFCFCVSEKLLPEEICALFFFFFLFPLIQPVNFRSFQFVYSSGSSQLAI